MQNCLRAGVSQGVDLGSAKKRARRPQGGRDGERGGAGHRYSVAVEHVPVESGNSTVVPETAENM